MRFSKRDFPLETGWQRLVCYKLPVCNMELSDERAAKNMMSTAIDITRTSSRKGIVAFGYTDPKWYLPVLFFVFEKFGFQDL